MVTISSSSSSSSSWACRMTTVSLLLALLVAFAHAQGFYTGRYGKRTQDLSDITIRSGFYANRYGRSSPSTNTQAPQQIKVRSSRFIGGSRYGKRNSGVSLIPALDSESPVIAASPVTGDDVTEVLGAFLAGDSFVCYVLEVPDVYRCFRKTASLSDGEVSH
ncbi:uncharacterized protein LOC143038777 [Oratosquilla oratoria]|uniref:uncharacterized protein LOC143038777 n=1 Tax=Oratosquilla oratoria TaxID=337810 RepID=UPI003F7724B5